MRRLTYIANPHSVHVDVWLKALAACGIPVRIETAAPRTPNVPHRVEVEHLVPRWFRGPSLLRYVWAGVAARFKRRLPGEILHAHCTSGNGLVAWLSGHSYMITTYGSEVLAASDRGWLYRWLIHRILVGADRITATSPQMVDVLIAEHGVPRERIHLFDLGLDTGTFHPAPDSERRQMRARLGIGVDEPVWISVKRAIPMNRTVEIAEAFFRYCDGHPQGRLVIICGDDESSYSSEVKRQVAASRHSDRVTVLAEWLEPPAVAHWLQLSDYAVSVPTSDQMSNAVLEAMACGALPVLLDIDGYRSLKERGAIVHWLDECSIGSLWAAFDDLAALPAHRRREQSLAAIRFIRRHYANRRVWEVLQQLYNLPATFTGVVDAAA